jgi:hypothetical protein
MKKILLHLSNENNYRSFARALVGEAKENIEIIGQVVHNNLFDMHNKIQPDIVILPTNEYTQEFHDYIQEYHNRVKIILFTNNSVVNTNIINFWNSMNVIIISKTEWYPEQQPNNFMSYDSLYDNEIYSNTNSNRNTKIAVYLSADDDKNQNLLKNVLYPNSKTSLVLFNSSTFKHPQNIGLLTPEDSAKILNTYDSLIDIDNRFNTEASACGIKNLSIDEDLINVISNKTLKPLVSDINEKSYSYFIKTTFLPTL